MSKTAPPSATTPPRTRGLTDLQRRRALLKTGALEKAILASANFSSIATDEGGVIRVFNVGAERLLGYTAAEVVGSLSAVAMCYPQDMLARAAALSAELGSAVAPGFETLVFKASRGVEDVYELTYLCKDGSRVPVVQSVQALRDADAVLIGYLMIGTDNSARKRVEAEQQRLDQRLRDQQFYTRSLIESIIDALITTDATGTITDVNRQTEALTGCTREELIGTPFSDYFTEPLRAQACIDAVLSDKQVTNYELTARSSDERQAVVSCNATTFYNRDSQLQGVIAAARDVTERKRLDHALQTAKSAAESANLAKSDFLSSMSHELRSPLNAILGFAQLMESGVPAPTPAQRDSVEQILQAGWYLLELINEILDLALIESGKLSLSPEPVSLAEVLGDCRAMIEPQARKSGIRLVFPATEVDFHVKADRTRLKQVFVNLLSNAIKYNRVGGLVEVHCSAVDTQRIRIGFQDTGEGLSQDKLEQLFQPFNRLGQETGTEEGTGIGLVVSQKLVHLMGGSIGAESRVGVGSLFWVEMNASAGLQFSAAVTDIARVAAPPSLAGAASRSVLCVEDNPANLLLVEKLLARRPDLRLLSARDGRSGVELARSAMPDVILMDINLPGISGIVALGMLAGDPSTAHIPVIALSANAMPHDIEKGLDAGFFRYLTKPIKVAEFMETLDAALAVAATRLGRVKGLGAL